MPATMTSGLPVAAEIATGAAGEALLAAGTRVALEHLASPEYEGSVGVVLDFDQAAGRYFVALEGGRCSHHACRFRAWILK